MDSSDRQMVLVNSCASMWRGFPPHLSSSSSVNREWAAVCLDRFEAKLTRLDCDNTLHISGHDHPRQILRDVTQLGTVIQHCSAVGCKCPSVPRCGFLQWRTLRSGTEGHQFKSYPPRLLFPAAAMKSPLGSFRSGTEIITIPVYGS